MNPGPSHLQAEAGMEKAERRDGRGWAGRSEREARKALKTKSIAKHVSFSGGRLAPGKRERLGMNRGTGGGPARPSFPPLPRPPPPPARSLFQFKNCQFWEVGWGWEEGVRGEKSDISVILSTIKNVFKNNKIWRERAAYLPDCFSFGNLDAPPPDIPCRLNDVKPVPHDRFSASHLKISRETP